MSEGRTRSREWTGGQQTLYKTAYKTADGPSTMHDIMHEGVVCLEWAIALMATSSPYGKHLSGGLTLHTRRSSAALVQAFHSREAGLQGPHGSDAMFRHSCCNIQYRDNTPWDPGQSIESGLNPLSEPASKAMVSNRRRSKSAAYPCARSAMYVSLSVVSA